MQHSILIRHSKYHSEIYNNLYAPSFLNLSLTLSNAFPNLFVPHSLSLPSASSALNPTPQILSFGLASIICLFPVPSNAFLHYSSWLNFK